MAGGQAHAQVTAPDNILSGNLIPINNASTRGVRVGGFLVSPGITVSSLYDDNIFLQKTGSTNDLLTSIKPGLAVQSNWNRHILYLGANANIGSYNTHSEKDFSDHGAIIAGQYELTEKTFLTASLTDKDHHATRGSEEDQNGGNTIDLSSVSQSLGFTRALSYWQFKILGKNEETRRETELDALAATDFVKRKAQSLSTTVSYVYMPLNELYIKNTLSQTAYHLINGTTEDSKKTDTQVGLNFDTTGLFSGSVYGGYLQRSNDFSLKGTNDPYLGGALSWRITPLTTLTALTTTTYSDPSLSAENGAKSTQYQISLKNSFTTRLDTTLTTGVYKNSYLATATASGRENEIYYTSLEADYRFSDNMGVRLGYDHKDKSSSLETDEYSSNKALLSLTYMH